MYNKTCPYAPHAIVFQQRNPTTLISFHIHLGHIHGKVGKTECKKKKKARALLWAVLVWLVWLSHLQAVFQRTLQHAGHGYATPLNSELIGGNVFQHQ